MWKSILQVSSTDPENTRRRRLLNILLVGIFISAIVGLIIAGYGYIAKAGEPSDISLLAIICLAFIVGATIIHLVNRHYVKIASYLFILLLVVAYIFSDTPFQISDGRSVFFFSIPIVIASLLIHPLASFILSAIGCVIITWAASTINSQPDFVVMIGFFMLALISWLSSRSLDQALKELRATNTSLDRLVQERTRDLANALARERVESGRSKAILESIADGVIVFDLHGIANIANPASERLLELSVKQIINTSIDKLSQNKALDAQNQGILADLLSSPNEQRTSYRIQWGKRTLSVTSAQVTDTEGNNIGTVAVFRDYTHEAEVEKMKSTFLAIVSHELRTPLNAILGYAEMIKEEIYGPVTEKQSQASERIMTNSRRLLDIVSDLLDQAQMEAGKLTFQIRSFRPEELLEAVHGVVDKFAAEKGLALTSELDPNLPDILNGDIVRLQQILVNLISNAIKYTDQGSIHARLYRTDTRHWSIEVLDTGEGIPEENLPQIFEAFRQVDSSATRKHGGFGLGLTIVKQLAELMGGEIKVSSKVGVGSAFTVTLPITHTRNKS